MHKKSAAVVPSTDGLVWMFKGQLEDASPRPGKRLVLLLKDTSAGFMPVIYSKVPQARSFQELGHADVCFMHFITRCMC